jgi:beta-phosphoglucomutase-like phosphatase (HAD superfamily)
LGVRGVSLEALETIMPDRNGYAAIWDMDGTLVDTAEQHFWAWAATAAERGRPFSRDDFTRTFGRRNPDIIHILFGDAIVGRDAEELADRKEVLYREAAAAGVELLPGVRALLEGLDRAGFRQAIGSSAPRANLELILRLTGVERFFPVVEDATAGVQAAKAGGMKCIAVRFVGHHSAEALRQAGADLITDSLEQVSAETVRQLLD